MPPHLLLQALAIMFRAIESVTTLTFFPAFFENRPFLSLMFEVASALGTVGFSVRNGGVLSFTAILTDFGKVIILCSMFLGRFGPLLVRLVSLTLPVRMLYRFPQANVAMGEDETYRNTSLPLPTLGHVRQVLQFKINHKYRNEPPLQHS